MPIRPLARALALSLSLSLSLLHVSSCSDGASDTSLAERPLGVDASTPDAPPPDARADAERADVQGADVHGADVQGADAQDAEQVDAQGSDAAADGAAGADADASSTLDAAVEASPPSDAASCGASLPAPSGAARSTPARLAHWEHPADPSLVALTFDDGPDDAGVTDRVLDVLRGAGVRATFFVNTRTKGDVRASKGAQATLARIVAEGHGLGGHGAHHLDLATLSDAAIEEELSLVEQDLALVPCLPRVTLVRAPYGSPFLGGSAAAVDRVAPIVGRHGVEIGWSIESLDWTCVGKGASCWLPRVLERIDLGRRGPILLHSTEPQTAAGLKELIDELRKRGLRFVLVEELVRAKYGASSAQLTADWRAK